MTAAAQSQLRDCDGVMEPCRWHGPSARTGPGSQRSVVDSVVDVNGMSGLRVADASIIPEILSSTAGITVVMLAEGICQASTLADRISRSIQAVTGRSPSIRSRRSSGAMS
jgi:hypothetical protein